MSEDRGKAVFKGGTPYVAFSNDELAGYPEVKEGDLIDCVQCDGKHPLGYGVSNGSKSGELGFYTCNGASYLGSVAGRLVTGRFRK